MSKQQGSQDELGLADVVRFLLDYKWLILVTTFVATAIALAIAYTTSPVYRAETVLALVSEDRTSSAAALSGQFTALASFAGINLGAGGAKEEALAVLRSRALTTRFIEKNNLLPILFSDRWDVANKRWRVDRSDEVPTLWRAVSKFQDNVQEITHDPVSGLVTLRIEWGDPIIAAKWAADITRMANELIRQRTIAEARQSIEFLKSELTKTTLVEIQQAISRVMETQTKMLTMASIRDEFAFRVIDPPTAADIRSPVRPRKSLIAVVGLVLGGMVGLLLAFGHAVVRNQLKYANRVR